MKKKRGYFPRQKIGCRTGLKTLYLKEARLLKGSLLKRTDIRLGELSPGGDGKIVGVL